MAAGTKTFTTQFLIGSKFVGKKGFAEANQALTRTQKTAMAVNRGIGAVGGGFVKLAGAIGVATLAYKALGKATEFWAEGWKASEDAVKVQEALGVAALRNAKRYKMSGSAIEKSVSGVSEKVAAVGFDSEDAMAGTTKLLESMSPKQIEGFAQAYADLTAKLKGATPGAEGFAEVSEQINSAILKGKAPWLSQIGATDAQIRAFKKLTPEARAAYLQQLIQNRLQGEAARVFETTSGKIAKAAKKYEDLGQILTGPFVARQGEMADAQLRLYTALEPVAELLASKMVPAMQNLAKWTADNQDKITAWGKAVVEWAGWAVDSFMWLQQKSENFFKPIADNTIREWNNITAGAQAAWDGMVAIWDKASGYFSSIVEAIGKAFIPLYNLIIKPFVDAYNYVAGLFPQKEPAKETPAYSGGARQESDYVPPWQQTGPPTAPAATGESEARTNQPGGSLPFPYTPSTGETAAANGDVAAKLDAKLGGRLKGQGAAIVAAAKKHGVDPYMLAAIAQTESAKGTSYSIRTRNAPVGMMKASDPSQHQSFASLEAGIEAGAALLKRGYISQGRTTPAQIGAKWAPPGARNDPNRTNAMWPGLVEKEMSRLKAEAEGPAKASLKGIVKEMNLQQRTSGATGGQNIAMNAPITVNGVTPGREALMAKKTALALRDPTAQLLTEIKRARTQEQRLGYV